MDILLEGDEVAMPDAEEEEALLAEAVNNEAPSIDTHTSPTPNRRRLGHTNITTNTSDTQPRTRSPHSPNTEPSSTHSHSHTPYAFRIINLLHVTPEALPTAHTLLDDVERYITQHFTTYTPHTHPTHTLAVQTPQPPILHFQSPPTRPSLLGSYVSSPTTRQGLITPRATPTTPRTTTRKNKRKNTHKHNKTPK